MKTKRQQFEERYPVPVGIYWDDHEKRYFTTWSAYCKELHKLSEEWTDRFNNFSIPCQHAKTHYSQRWGEHVCSYCGESQQS